MYCRLVKKVGGKDICKEMFEEIEHQPCNCCSGNKNVQHVICKVVDTPHYKFIEGDKEPYVNYLKEAGSYAGYGIEHSPSKYEKLIKEFDPKKSKPPQIVNHQGKQLIIDGIHRSCIMDKKDIKLLK